ncbi:MAG TPA: hypothetical protein VJ771_05555 [Candidatus Nitrosotalea sp.]|nr:hypothetical protein [Candidatus Nitrosotalea sp.]
MSATPNENEKNNDETNVTPVTHGSDYEIDLENLMEVMRDKLKKLKTNPKSTSEELKEVEEEIRTLESLHENYDESMNVFRNT